MGDHVLFSIMTLGFSYCIYHWILKPGTTFKLNRFFLLGTLVVSLLGPFTEFERAFDFPLEPSFQAVKGLAQSSVIEDSWEGPVVEGANNESNLHLVYPIIRWLYMLVTTILVIRFLFNLWKVISGFKRNALKVSGLRLVLLERETSPFSFFNFLFVNKGSYEKDGVSQAVLTHEKAHFEQYHSMDVMVTEILICFFWFNPFIWKYKQAISENHEYLADDFVVKYGTNLDTYVQEIIESSQSVRHAVLGSGFSYVQTKNRLNMLYKSKNNPFTKISKLVGISLFMGGFIILSAFEYTDNSAPLIVVIDVGHGGKDPGAMHDGVNEKEITLGIANRLTAMSSNTKVKIIQTRSTDKFLLLNERVEYINFINPDLLISLHVKTSENITDSGLEAFYFTGDFAKESEKYCQVFVDGYLNENYNSSLVKRANFFILKNSHCPGVLLELGYLSNTEELEMMRDAMGQQKIAEGIFKGLLEIQGSRK